MFRYLPAVAGCCFVFLITSLTDGMQVQSADFKIDSVSFDRDIQPLLRHHCYRCHGPTDQQADLRLDSKSDVFHDSDESVIQKGNAQSSRLFQRISGLGDEDQMPPDAPPLSPKEIETIRRWIDEGAFWPNDVHPETGKVKTHWAYVAPQRSTPPTNSISDWNSNPIDQFVMEKLASRGLQPSPEENRARLIRRVYLDLIGIPPSVEEVDAFLKDASPDAYERVVDHLLNSKHYGERWAVPWLDAARYADSNGYQADQYREVWPYRDWVVSAINADMPFDQFTIEQLAGDLLPDPTMKQKIATGFHRQTTCNVEAGVDPEENRMNQVIDRVNTTGMVWLGTTLECAQCHDHKYDPFSQRDYYRLMAYFNNTPLEVKHTTKTTFDFYGPKMDVPLPPDATSHQKKLSQQLIATRQQLSKLLERLVAEQPAWEERKKQQLIDEATHTDGEWNCTDIVEFHSSGGASHTILPDQSILVSGKRPAKDTYRVTVSPDRNRISAIKLDALTHPDLPGNGPGRHHDERPNFVLTDFALWVRNDKTDGLSRRIKFKSAWADFSHKDYAVANAIDDQPNSGWAIHQEFHQPHVAIFFPEEPISLESGAQLELQLSQNHGGGRTLGRLRFSVSHSDQTPSTATPDASFPPDLAEILQTPDSGRTEDQQARLMEFYQSEQPQFVKLTNNIDRLTLELGESLSATTLVMTEQTMPRATAVLERGDFRQPQDKVEPGTPKALHSMPALATNRLGLAQWIVDRKNPLTSRVIVNRWWNQIFGVGIVRSPEDFGTQGEPPTHPELLDWLAVELTENGWSRKKLHRLMVTSSTYRQSSRISERLLQIDPENRWLARMSRFRLPAEMIRDNGLAISGLLSRSIGGPPVYPPQPTGVWRHVGRNAPKYDTDTDEDRFRRGLYVVWRRSAPYPSFVNFDAPDRATCVVQRSRANTPLQALTLLNDQAYVEMSWAFARKIANHDTVNLKNRIAFAFRSCVARHPTLSEMEMLITAYQQELSQFEEQPTKAKKLVATNQVPKTVTREQFATWFIIASILLNLDETISKG